MLRPAIRPHERIGGMLKGLFKQFRRWRQRYDQSATIGVTVFKRIPFTLKRSFVR